MKPLRVAVPSGVGDTYWCLSKLKDFRQKHGFDRVTLCVQRTKLTRALEWARMVDFVDEAREFFFRPPRRALRTGITKRDLPPGADVCFWPNAVIDRGEHISRWMPEYELDLDFEVACEAPNTDRSQLGVVYASSEGIHNAWFPMLKPEFWRELIDRLNAAQTLRTGLIGAGWDNSFREQLGVPPQTIDLVGKTSLMQVAGVLRHARVVVGVISGMTILANHFQTPCVAFCPDKFPESFPHAWIKPGTPYTVLRPAQIHSPAQVAEIVLGIARK